MEWLEKITNWFREQFGEYWDAFVRFMSDFLLTVLEFVCDVGLYVIDLIPVPDFVTQYTPGALLAQAGPEIAWLAGVLRLSECFVILAAGIVFYLVRKLLTLGQW